MAIYHLSSKVLSRSAGRNAVNAAAYRHGAEMFDERSGSRFSYELKSDVLHSELTVPEKAPAWARRLAELHASDPVRASEALWNRVEQHEKRGDAQLARELELALPRELTDEQRVVLVREFVTEQLAGRGMVADWAVHQGKNENPHAHVLMTMRPLTEDGFGAKKVPMLDPETGAPLRDARGKIRYAFGDAWGTKEGLLELREKWAEYQNFHLALYGHEVQVDHRSFENRGIELVPTTHIGVHAKSMDDRGKRAERVQDHQSERLENARKILDRPEHVFELITHRQAVFSSHDVAREVGRYVDDPEVFQQVLTRLSLSPERVELVAEEKGEKGRVIQPARYSTREMVKAERRMVEAAEQMAAATSHGVEGRHVEAALLRRPELSDEQRSAVLHMTGAGRIATVAGAAGAGKSTTLAAAREAWEAQGYRVRGAALAGKAADGLRESAGIPSRTIHSLEYAWKSGRDELTSRDVLVIDEAGMVGSRQLGRVLDAADRAGAKVVLVGDARQLQPIEAGAAFRAIAEQVGVVELETIRRQREDWARQASQDFARGAIGSGLDAYRRRGQVEFLEDREEAKAALARDWMEHRGEGSSIILAHTNQDVHDLNEAVRGARRLAGELGDDAAFSATKGARQFASGDRLVFLENSRELGVKNGTLGAVEEASRGELEVKLDGGERVRVREAGYASVDHGYAVTIHKAQGVTVDHAYVLASGGMDRHLAYVAMTRHREKAILYAGRDDFQDHGALEAQLSRARPKETTLDFAERRGIDTPRADIENSKVLEEMARERRQHALEEKARVAELARESERLRRLERELGAKMKADLRGVSSLRERDRHPAMKEYREVFARREAVDRSLAQLRDEQRLREMSPAEREREMLARRKVDLGAKMEADLRGVSSLRERDRHPAMKEYREISAQLEKVDRRLKLGELSLEDKLRLDKGEKLEPQWNAIVAKELSTVREKATGIGMRVGRDIAELRERLAEHREMEPQKPNAVVGFLAGRARYEAARGAWAEEHRALQNRERQLEKRAAWVNEYAREPVSGYPTQGTELARRKAELREPELARQVGEYRGWRQAREHARVAHEFEHRRDRERALEHGFER